MDQLNVGCLRQSAAGVGAVDQSGPPKRRALWIAVFLSPPAIFSYITTPSNDLLRRSKRRTSAEGWPPTTKAILKLIDTTAG